jgi:hypothetical protein
LRKCARQALAPGTKNKLSLYFPALPKPPQSPKNKHFLQFTGSFPAYYPHYPTLHFPCLSCFLPFSGRHQKQVVASPSLNSPERSEGDGWCWANLQNTHFSGLTRKNPVFERSVLKYVSIKNRILTPSGQKSRVCVNALDRLSNSLCIFQLIPRRQA